MKRYFLSFLVMTTLSTVAFAQTTKEKQDQVKNNPQTTENAARADAQTINKNKAAENEALKKIAQKRKEQKFKHKRKKTAARSTS